LESNIEENQTEETNLNYKLKNKKIYFSRDSFFELNSYPYLFLLIISQFKPQSIISLSNHYHNGFIFEGINLIWIFAQLLSFLIISYRYMKNHKIHLFNIIFFLSVLYIGLVSFLNGTPVSRIASILIPPISIFMLLELTYRYQTFYKLINTIYIYFGSMIILNYISMLIFPDSFFTDYRGLNVTWIFGNYQQNLNWFIVFIAFSCFVKEIWNEYIKYFNMLVYLIIILTTVKVWSATTLSALGIVFGLLICYHFYPRISIFLNPFYAYIVEIITTILIVVYKIQEHFTYFIEIVLQKNVSFTGRTTLWENAINYIKEKPIFGHGIELADVTFAKIGKTTAHNHYLNLLYNGGILYLLLTSILIYIVVVKTKSNRYSKSIVYINISLIGYFVYFLAEAKINLNIFILLLAGSYYLSKSLNSKVKSINY